LIRVIGGLPGPPNRYAMSRPQPGQGVGVDHLW
jgi:hypothetical protein